MLASLPGNGMEVCERLQRPPTGGLNPMKQPTMSDWKHLQMIKASGWPLAADVFVSGTDFNAPLEGGLVPLHWACEQGKAGLVEYMLAHGADVATTADNGQSMLDLAIRSGSFQTVMLLIERLKATAAPPPDEALQKRLHAAFGRGHANAKNRLLQALKDWERKRSAPGVSRSRPASAG